MEFCRNYVVTESGSKRMCGVRSGCFISSHIGTFGTPIFLATQTPTTEERYCKRIFLSKY
jgi:hypothetical protein